VKSRDTIRNEFELIARVGNFQGGIHRERENRAMKAEGRKTEPSCPSVAVAPEDASLDLSPRNGAIHMTLPASDQHRPRLLPNRAVDIVIPATDRAPNRDMSRTQCVAA
jgi:hypothetical protein